MTAGFGRGGALSDLAMTPGCAGNLRGFEESWDGSKLFGLTVPFLAAHFPMQLKRVAAGLPGRRLRHFGSIIPQKTHMKKRMPTARMNTTMNVLLELRVRRSRFRCA